MGIPMYMYTYWKEPKQRGGEAEGEDENEEGQTDSVLSEVCFAF